VCAAALDFAGRISEPEATPQLKGLFVMLETTSHAHHGSNSLPRNPGTALTLEWFEGHQVNTSAAERRAATLTTRRTVKKEYQAAWLVKALQCIDLTTLAGDDTPGRVHRLCAKAIRPLRDDIVQHLGLVEMPHVGAVCVYPTMVPHAVKALRGSGIPVASVATGFPAGLTPLSMRLAEIKYAVKSIS
jgi:deoxyribose-phosphate aldolase